MSTIEGIFSSINNYFFPETMPSEGVRLEGIDPIDTLESAVLIPTHEEWVPQRPILTPPQSLPMSTVRLLCVTETTRSLGEGMVDNMTLRLENAKESIRDVSAENMRILREAALKAQNSNWWSVLKKVATAVVSAVSVFFGIAVLSSGGTALVGGAMIASGILSLTNFALAEFGAWDWISQQLAHGNEDLRKQLAWILPSAVGIVAGGIGIAGSIHGFVYGGVNYADKIASALQGTVATFLALTSLGKGHADAYLLWTQADLKINDAELTIEQDKFSGIIESLKGSMKEFQTINAKSKKAIQTIAQSNVQLTRHV